MPTFATSSSAAFRRFGPASLPFDLATVRLWELRVGAPVSETSAVDGAANLDARPLLLIEDERDDAVLPDSIERIREAAGPDTQYWLAEASRHARGFFDHPEEYAAVVTGFWLSTLGGEEARG